MSEKPVSSALMTNQKSSLSPRLLYTAYSQGYFPMPDETTGEIFWYRPDPRAIIPLDGFHTSRSLKRKLKKGDFKVTYDQAFDQVVTGCAQREVTWINDEIKASYGQMHRIGAAHSVEIWNDAELVGGVYGLSFGGAFFAESMFSKQADASKIALFYLVEKLAQRGFILLECQFLTDHLKSLGAHEIPDHDYMKILNKAVELDIYFE